MGSPGAHDILHIQPYISQLPIGLHYAMCYL